MATIGTLVVTIKANTADLVKAGTAIRTFANKASRSFLSLKGAIAGLGIGYLAVDLIKTGAQFEKTMAKVSAVTGATDKQFDALTKSAKLMGETTEYTASQAADALAFLGMASFEAGKAIEALPGVLDLATAGNIDLGRAADIASNALTAMRLPVEQLSRVNDVMVQGIRSANVDMNMLAESFKYGAPIAAGMGIEIEELVGLIGALGNAGIQGSMAGTQLAFAMVKNSEVLAKLGEDTKRADGTVKTLTDTLRILEERSASTQDVMELFGQRAGRGVSALLGMGTEEVERLINRMKEAEGVSTEVANTMRDTVAGSFMALVSAIESIKIDAFSKNAGDLKDTIDGLTVVIRDNKDTIVAWVNGGLNVAVKSIAWAAKKITEMKTAFVFFRTEAANSEKKLLEMAIAQQRVSREIELTRESVARLTRMEEAMAAAWGRDSVQFIDASKARLEAQAHLTDITLEQRQAMLGLGIDIGKVTDLMMTKSPEQLGKRLKELDEEVKQLNKDETAATKTLTGLNDVLAGQGAAAAGSAGQMKLLAEQAKAVGENAEKSTEGLIKIQSTIGDFYAMMGQAPPVEILSPEEAKEGAKEWKKEIKFQFDTAMSGIEKRYATAMRNIDRESKLAAEAFDKTLLGGFDKAITEMEDKQITFGKIAEEAWNTTSGSLGKAFYDMATDWDGTWDGMEDIAQNAMNSILNSFLQLATQMMAEQIMLNIAAPAISSIAGGALQGLGAQGALAALPGIGGLFGGGAAAAPVAAAPVPGLVTAPAGIGLGLGGGAAAAAPGGMMAGLGAAATAALPIAAAAAATFLVGNEIAGIVESRKRTAGSEQREKFQSVLEDIFGFENFNRRALGVFEKQGIAAENMQEQFKRFGMSVGQATAFAEKMRDEMGITGTTVEDMTSMLIAGFEEAGKTATDFAKAMETQAAALAFSAEGTFEQFKAFKEAQKVTERVGFLEQLKLQLIDVASAMDLTNEEFDRTQKFLKEIEDALSGDISAYEHLEDVFGNLDETAEQLTTRIEGQKESLEKLNQAYDDQADIVSDLESELESAIRTRDELMESELKESSLLKQLKRDREALETAAFKEGRKANIADMFRPQIAAATTEEEKDRLQAAKKEQEQIIDLLAKFRDILPTTNIAFGSLEEARKFVEEALGTAITEEQERMEAQRQDEIQRAQAGVQELEETLAKQREIRDQFLSDIVALEESIAADTEALGEVLNNGAETIKDAIVEGGNILTQTFKDAMEDVTVETDSEGVQFVNKQ